MKTSIIFLVLVSAAVILVSEAAQVPGIPKKKNEDSDEGVLEEVIEEVIEEETEEEEEEEEKEEVALAIGGYGRSEQSNKVYVINEDLEVTSGDVPDIPMGIYTWKGGLIDDKVVMVAYGYRYQLTLSNLTWQKTPGCLEDMRAWHSAAVCDGALYIFGGNYGGNVFSSVEKFDGTSWSPVKNMPEGLWQHCTVEHEGKIYIIGGRGGKGKVATLCRFDPSSGEYIELAPVPIARYGHSCAVVEIGGIKGIMVAGGKVGYDDPINSTVLYNIETNKWSTLADLNTPRIFGELVFLGGRPVLMGGRTYVKSTFMKRIKKVENLEVYNENKKKWDVVNSTLNLEWFGLTKIPAAFLKKKN